MTEATEAIPEASARFSIFRKDDAVAHGMEYFGMSDVVQAGLARVRDLGGADGQLVRTIFAAPGFNLTYAWFKSSFPLPRHSHDADCLYYLIAGSLRIGTHTVTAGDGFFVPAEVPYAYTPGPDGVELLEFRNREHFNIRFKADNPAFWERAAQRVDAEHAGWAVQRPTALAPRQP